MLPPERAVWPLPPLPLVLPWPPPSPQPTRFLRCTAPFTFRSSWSFIWFVPLWRPDDQTGSAELGSFSVQFVWFAELPTSNAQRPTSTSGPPRREFFLDVESSMLDVGSSFGKLQVILRTAVISAASRSFCSPAR